MQLKNHDLTITLNEKGAIQKIVDRKLNRSYLEVERTLPRKRMETFWGHSKILLQPTEKA